MSDKPVLNYLSEQKKSAEKLIREVDERKVLEIINTIEKVSKRSGTIYTIGNGGSASTAKHLAADLEKTADQEIDINIQSQCLVSNEPLITAWTNDSDWSEVYKGQLQGKINDDDLIIAISVHGGSGPWSGNLTKALTYANEQNASTIGISGFDGGEFKNICDQNIIIEKNSTPLVESLHVLIHHLTVFGLIQKRK